MLKLCDLNVAFAPEKTENPNSLQLTYLKDGTTRHIYVYHDDPQTIVNWYMAIRFTKLHRLQVAYPAAIKEDVSLLTFYYNLTLILTTQVMFFM